MIKISCITLLLHSMLYFFYMFFFFTIRLLIGLSFSFLEKKFTETMFSACIFLLLLSTQFSHVNGRRSSLLSNFGCLQKTNITVITTSFTRIWTETIYIRYCRPWKIHVTPFLIFHQIRNVLFVGNPTKTNYLLEIKIYWLKMTF